MSMFFLNWGCQDWRYNSSNEFNSGQLRDKTPSLFLLGKAFFFTPEYHISHQTLHWDLMLRWLIFMFFIHRFARQIFHPEHKTLASVLQTSVRFPCWRYHLFFIDYRGSSGQLCSYFKCLLVTVDGWSWISVFTVRCDKSHLPLVKCTYCIVII